MDKRKFLSLSILIAIGIIFQIFIHDGFNLFNSKNKTELIYKNSPVVFPMVDKTIPFNGDFQINNPAGDIILESSEDDQSHINITARIFHEDKNDAVKIRNDLRFSLKTEKGMQQVRFDSEKEFPYQYVRLTYRLKISKKAHIFVTGQLGKLDVRSLNSPLEVIGDALHINIEDAKRKIFLKKARNSQVNLDGCNEIVANLIDSTSIITSPKGNIKSFCKGGSIKITAVDNPKQAIGITSKQSRVSLSGIVNDSIDVNISFEDVFIKQVQSNTMLVKQKNGNFVLDLAPNQAENHAQTISVDAKDAKILIRQQTKQNPSYTIDLTYGEIRGDRYQSEILKRNHTQKLIKNDGLPKILIRGEYSDVKITEIEG